MKISVNVSTKKVTAELIALGSESKAAISRALNKTSTGVREEAVRIVGSKLDIKKGMIRKRITAYTSFGLAARVTISAKPSPLLDFKKVSFARRTRQGVSFVRVPGGPRKRLKHAFILQLNSGPRVMERAKGPGGRFVGRLPVKAVVSTSAANLIRSPAILASLLAYAEDRFAREIEREVRFRIGRRQG